MPEETYVNITLYGVPGSLVKEFMQKIVRPNHPGGISPAIVDLIRKAVQQQ
jgi:hypothetical protein